MLRRSLTELQNIAKQGETKKYGIKIGQIFQINSKVCATIVAIGNDYITCAASLKNEEFDATYYVLPPLRTVNVADFEYPVAEVGYPNSDLKKKLNDWFNKQSDEFKSVTKDTIRTYEMHLLTHEITHGFCVNDCDMIVQGFKEFQTLTEKVFIPTKTEIEFLDDYVSFDNFTWTSSPDHFCEEYPTRSDEYGYFFQYGAGSCAYSQSGSNFVYGNIILFRIG